MANDKLDESDKSITEFSAERSVKRRELPGRKAGEGVPFHDRTTDLPESSTTAEAETAKINEGEVTVAPQSRRLERNERETQILRNEGDAANGYFLFSTTEQHVIKRFLKRVGGKNNLLKFDEHKDKNGRIVSWVARVPNWLFSRSSFGIINFRGIDKPRGRPFPKRK